MFIYLFIYFPPAVDVSDKLMKENTPFLFKICRRGETQSNGNVFLGIKIGYSLVIFFNADLSLYKSSPAHPNQIW